MLLLPQGLLWLCLSVTLSDPVAASRPRPNILRRMNPTFAALSDTSLAQLAQLTDLDNIINFSNPASVLSRLLVPRPAGSPKLIELQALIEKHFTDLGWHVERDAFEASTPYGVKSFTNLVFTHDPDAVRKLVLAAHLDSKFFPTSPNDGFVGATDSAAPCAMLMDVATALTPWLDLRKERVVTLEGGEENRDVQGETLQIVLFDGEEAFKVWTHEDSIYGAKHLVERWKQPTLGPQASATLPPTPLARISHLILLDLLGAPNPVIRSFYTSTGWLFDEFEHAEERLGAAGLLWEGVADVAGTKERSFFVSRKGATTYGGGIEDDHLPFLANGVPVVHLIPLPFPHVWHTLDDDVTALDFPTIKAWTLIIRLAVAEYLGLAPPSTSSNPSGEKADPTRLRRAGGDELVSSRKEPEPFPSSLTKSD